MFNLADTQNLLAIFKRVNFTGDDEAEVLLVLRDKIRRYQRQLIEEAQEESADGGDASTAD